MSVSVKMFCYILAELGTDLWKQYIPTSKCSGFIYVVSDFPVPPHVEANLKYLQENHTNMTVSLGVQVTVETLDSPTFCHDLITLVFKLRLNGIHLIWKDRANLELGMKKKLLEDIRQMEGNYKGQKTVKKIIYSRSVVCKPGIENKKAIEKNFDFDFDLIFVHVELREQDLEKFSAKPEVCLKPLFDYGQPIDKIVIGLSRVISNQPGRTPGSRLSVMYRDVCNTKRGVMFYEVIRSISCLARNERLYGIMLWEVNTDDPTGIYCHQGAFPLLSHANYTLGLSNENCTASGDEDLLFIENSSGVMLNMQAILLLTVRVIAVIFL